MRSSKITQRIGAQRIGAQRIGAQRIGARRIGARLMSTCLTGAAFILALSAPANAGVYYVDAGGSGDSYTTIQSAIDAASSGSVILVRPGTYAGFDLAKGIVIRATRGSFEVTSRVQILDIPLGQVAGISGMKVQTVQGLLLMDCQGEVVLDDIVSYDADYYESLFLYVRDCATVFATDVRMDPAPFSIYHDRPSPITIERSQVTMTATVIKAPRHISSTCRDHQCIDGYDGCPGIHALCVTDSTLILSGVDIQGGDGGNGDCGPPFENPGEGGIGGTGVFAERSQVIILGTESDSIRGGTGGENGRCSLSGSTGCGEGDGGPGLSGESFLVSRVLLEGGQGRRVGPPFEGDVTIFNRLPVLSFPGPLQPGRSVDITVQSVVPADIFVLGSARGFLGDGTGGIGPQLSLFPPFFGPIYVRTDSSGIATVPLILLDEPEIQGVPFHLQAAVLGDDSSFYFTNAVVRIAESQILDCNGNGAPDDEDIVEGFSRDCNNDYIPDECQDQSDDCNGNGLWDWCDVADGRSEDHNTNGVPDECEANRHWYVDDDAPGDPGPNDPEIGDPEEDGSPEHPYDSLEEAIGNSISGDTVLVAAGMYQGRGNNRIGLGTRRLILIGNGPKSTVIDSNGGGHVFSYQDAPVGGLVTGFEFRNAGGCIRLVNTSLTVTDCSFVDGLGYSRGGGVFLDGNSHLEIASSTFIGNRAYEDGGAVFVGAGARLDVDHCVFISNRATECGGAIFSRADSGPVSIRSTEFRNNRCSEIGGAIAVRGFGDSQVLVTGSTFQKNRGDQYGGAIGISGGGSRPVEVRSSTFFDNTCNIGGGSIAAFAGRLTLHHAILWEGDCNDSGNEIRITSPGYVEISYCDIQNGLDGIRNDGALIWGPGIIDSDPRFENSGTYDLHLGFRSPCIESGDPGYSPPSDETDIDGDARVMLRVIDMGADESKGFERMHNDSGQ